MFVQHTSKGDSTNRKVIESFLADVGHFLAPPPPFPRRLPAEPPLNSVHISEHFTLLNPPSLRLRPLRQLPASDPETQVICHQRRGASRKQTPPPPALLGQPLGDVGQRGVGLGRGGAGLSPFMQTVVGAFLSDSASVDLAVLIDRLKSA